MLLYSAWLTDMFRDHQTTASPYQGSQEDAIHVPVSLATSSFSLFHILFGTHALNALVSLVHVCGSVVIISCKQFEKWFFVSFTGVCYP